MGSCFGLKTEKNLITTSHVFTVINFTGLCFKTCDHCLSSTIVYYSESWGRGERDLFVKLVFNQSLLNVMVTDVKTLDEKLNFDLMGKT